MRGNASQMICNFSDVFKRWAFIVRLMRKSGCSVHVKYTSSHVVLPGAAIACVC